MSRRPADALDDLLKREPLPVLAAAARDHGAPVLCVGGAVRDALLGRVPADIDVAVAGGLDAFVARFAALSGRNPVPIGDEWRDTRRTRIDGVQVDIGAMLGDLDADLKARDFTINAMAVRLDEDADAAPQLLDPLDGRNDLDARVLRTVSHAALESDPLRALRALRYVASLPGFRLDEQTAERVAATTTTISNVAGERVQAEWQFLLAAEGWLEGLELAVAVGLDEPTLSFRIDSQPAARWARFENGLEAGADGEVVELRLAAMLVGAAAEPAESHAEALSQRRWPRDVARRSDRIARWARELSPVSDMVRWALEDSACAAHAALLARALSADDATQNAADELETYVERAAEPRWVTGDALREWGMRQGPALGKVLDEAARGQLGRRWAEPEQARDWARQRASEAGQHGG